MNRFPRLLLSVFIFALPSLVLAVDPPPAPAEAEAVPMADYKESKSPASREDFAKQVKEEILLWGKRIEKLQQMGTPKTDETAKFLRTMDLRARADLVELEKVEQKTWLDVKARIELRFRRMEKEFKKATSK